MIHTTLIEHIRSTKVKDLAEALQITPEAIYMWVQRNTVPPKYWYRLVRYFKLDPELMLGDSHEKSALHQDRN